MMVKIRIINIFICLMFSVGPGFGHTANLQLNPPLVPGGSVSTGFLVSHNNDQLVYLADQYTLGEHYLFRALLEAGSTLMQLTPNMVPRGWVRAPYFAMSLDSRWVVYRGPSRHQGDD